MSSYLEIKKLVINHKTFEGIRNVIDIDSLKIKKGKTYGIVGESGAGKTILALTILGLLQTPPGKIESGEIIFEGENLLKKSNKVLRESIRGNKISMIFQDPMSSLNPVFTIGYQMIQIIKKNQNLKKDDARLKAVEMLDIVKLPDAKSTLRKYPHELSGGQRQRVIIAMALSCGAELLIADEPTRNLDVTIQSSILKTLKEIQNKMNVTVLFIANNLSLVATFCDKVGILKDGKIIEENDVHSILTQPKMDYTKFLINSVTDVKKEPKKSNNSEIILEVKNLKKYFEINKKFFSKKSDFVKAVDGVDLTIRKGDIIGIVGESGCGKSTLVNTILNLHKPTSGEVIFKGKNIFELEKQELDHVRKNIQIVFQDPFWSLNPRWLVKDIIAEPILVHENISSTELLSRVKNLLKMVGLNDSAAYKYPHEFSGGQRQRIAIARALSVEPEIIVLDEPTSAIDVVSQVQILQLLKDLKKDLDLTNILISHDLSVVHDLCDKLHIMYLGKIVEYGEANRIFQKPLHPYTIALFESIPTLEKSNVNDLAQIVGEVPSAINPPEGCRFHTRCPRVMEKCKTQIPLMKEFESDRIVACFALENDYGRNNESIK